MRLRPSLSRIPPGALAIVDRPSVPIRYSGAAPRSGTTTSIVPVQVSGATGPLTTAATPANAVRTAASSGWLAACLLDGLASSQPFSAAGGQPGTSPFAAQT